MRVLGLPSGFYIAIKRPTHDVPPEARTRALMVAWIDERRARGATRDDACRILGVTPRTYTRWRATLRRDGVRALADHRSASRKRDPWRRREVREAVERLRQQHPCGKEKLAILLARQGVTVSASTVGRVLRELMHRGRIQRLGWRPQRLWRPRPARTHARRQRPFEKALHPGDLVQIDTLHEYSTLKPRYHFSAVDPTRKFAHARLFERASSRSAERFLIECLERWPDRIRSVQVDNGSEFRGDFERACATLGLELVTIAPHRPQRNGCVERLQRTFRDEHYAFEPASLDLAGANTHLDAYLQYYNHERPHHALSLKTPMEYAPLRNPHQTGHVG
jgi:transposase InsO family protein